MQVFFIDVIKVIQSTNILGNLGSKGCRRNDFYVGTKGMNEGYQLLGNLDIDRYRGVIPVFRNNSL